MRRYNMESTAGGMSFFAVLALLFIGLKLTDYVDWSWVWVLSPLWLPWGLILAGALVTLLGSAIILTIEYGISYVKKFRQRDRG